MGRRATSIEDYWRLGDERGLVYIERYSPNSVRLPVRWKCKNCGRVYHRSFHATKYGITNGCYCRSMTLTPDHYHDLAKNLGLKWIGKELPHNTRQVTTWLSLKQNVPFEASYRQLGYGRIPKRFMEYVLE